MNHRPRTSGQQKSRVLSSRNNLASTKKVSSTKTRKKSKSPTSDTANGVKCEPVRKVTLNTSLPTASPTFQRAMLNLRSSEVNGTEIMSQKRRDSILQNYQLTETVLSSFRDDNDLSKVGARSDTLEVMTNRFREDMKEYKSGWSPREQGKVRKSILKKRRQSVDDMEISTRKNLAKYLESKLNIDDDDKRHDKMVGFH